MNAPLPKEAAPLSPEVAASLDAAAALVGGDDVAKRTVRAVYHLGRMSGMLEMAAIDEKRLRAAIRNAP